ncbi:cilia- and flagella-associated protein 99 isoform X2 [Esox lucius]|uniref:Cilia and flagella associated protein 99 n=2 Tax=Esox lucius TaxID=8010 RepID=A0A3P8Y0E4_ESOLU|nr:cilia- and flagella-associated protein 99 isoform X2 [Esox lucius]XP_019909459.1 cilia- and flagella-associated protein 99 isoform X2 [Esox lucius]
MAKGYAALIKEATVLLDQFNADKQCVEEFIDNASKDMENLDPLDKKFILDIIYGCIEHKRILDVVINVFYAQCGKCLLKADRSQFAIICYLSVFLLDDLGLQCFSKIVNSLDIKKIYQFLSFFFNITNLSTWIQGEWSQIYDASYVEKNWIAPLLRWRPEIEILMAQQVSRMSGESQVKKTTKETTKPQEFSLTKPKSRPLPVPLPVPPQEKKTHVVPTSTYRTPKEKQNLEEIKQRNRQKAEHVLYEANTQQFKCANTLKSERTKSVISQIVQSHDTQCKFDSVYTSGSPATHKTNNLPIRLNTTAILREGALYNRQVEEELRRMEQLVEGAGEPSSFLKWQREMRDQDLQEELAQVERRRLEGRISYEEAALARTRITECNQKTALLKKEETAKLMQRYANKRLQEEKEMRDLVQQVADGHKNSKAAKRKLHEFKKRIVKEVSEQSQELLRQALEEAQAELSRKFEIISQIRAIESVPLIKHKFVDETETAGHDLLGEMSLAELRERLSLLRDAEQREQQDRRERILGDKQGREQLLLEQLDTISLHRAAQGQAAIRRQEEKRARQELRWGVHEDERVVALQRRLEEKKQERQKLKQSEKTKANTIEKSASEALKSWNHRKHTLEEKHWADLERSLERQVQQEAPDTVSQKTFLKA